MQVTFLGTGSAMPTGRRNQTGLLFERDEETLLIDCGSGVLNALSRTEVGYEGVETVLLTHHHLDHVSDLMVLLKARWLAGAETLTVVGPPGTESLVTGLLDVHEYMQDRVDLTLRDIDPTDNGTAHHVAGFAVRAMETRHSMPCYAYHLSPPGEDETSVAFSGDTEAFPELIEFADGAGILIHDCSFPDAVDVANHPTPATLGETLAAADATVGRVYLTHLYPHTDGKHSEMLDSIADNYDGDVRLASDGLSVDLEATE